MSTWAEVQTIINNLLTLEYDGANDIQRFRQAFTLIINQINAGDADPENDSLWDPATVYPADILPAFWRDEWVVSEIDDNEGIEPIDSGGVLAPEWRIASASNGTGISFWEEKIYPNTLEIIFYNNKLLFLDRTVVGTTPFSSLDIDVEITEGKWKSFFGDYYKGLYASLAALQAAYPSASAGDYADVDLGVGESVQRYLWDNDDDDWVLGSGVGLPSGPDLLDAIDAAVGDSYWRTGFGLSLVKTENLNDVDNKDTANDNLIKGQSIRTFILANELTFDDFRGKKSIIQQAGTRAFTLAASGNLDGAIIEARINEPASEPTFSSDFNKVSGGDVYDNSKLLSILFRYDAERSKVDYFYKNLPAVDTISPTISTAIVGNSDKDGLVITFIEDVNITDLTGLSLSFSVGTPKTIISVAGTGTSILTFTLSADIDPSDEFDLVIGAANNIEDNAGNGLVAVTQSVTNNVTNTFDVNTISPEHIHLPMDIAGTNADPATSITDLLSSTPYNFDNVAGIPRAIQNSKECLNFTSTIIRTVSTSLSTLFQNSFSASLQIKLTDGNPTSTKYFMHIANAAISRFIVDLRTDGKITVTYTSNSVSVFAQTAAAVFADGAMSDFSQIVVKVPSGGTIDILLDGISQTLSGSFNGNMSGVNMALFNSSTEKLRIGANTDGAGFGGWGRQFTLQPVIYSAGNITDLDSL
jgi:hypothetical protein